MDGSDTLLPLSGNVRVGRSGRVEALGFVGGRVVTGGQILEVRVDVALDGSDTADVLDVAKGTGIA